MTASAVFCWRNKMSLEGKCWKSSSGQPGCSLYFSPISTESSWLDLKIVVHIISLWNGASFSPQGLQLLAQYGRWLSWVTAFLQSYDRLLLLRPVFGAVVARVVTCLSLLLTFTGTFLRTVTRTVPLRVPFCNPRPTLLLATQTLAWNLRATSARVCHHTQPSHLGVFSKWGSDRTGM